MNKAKQYVIITAAAALCAALAVAGYFYFKDSQPPRMLLTPASGTVGPATAFRGEASDESGLRLFKAVFSQGNKTFTMDADLAPGDTAAVLEFNLAEAGFTDGPLSVVISAVDGSWKRMGKGIAAETALDLTFDAKPPSISVTSMAHNVNRGGTGCIVYRVNEAVTGTGVTVGELYFPGHPLADGGYACLFAFPEFMELDEYKPRLTAVDEAGNTASRGFVHHFNDRAFRTDTIRLPDSFLERKMPEFEGDTPGQMTPLERFIKVNRDLRASNRAAMYEICGNTSPEPLWHGIFLRLPNAANRAGFGDRRSYVYNGEVVDHQTHMGIDLASVRAAPVPAANAGRVAWTGTMGIYGNAVVLDHGLGLMTMYAHLSEIAVDKGDAVDKGRIIGRTGSTGLAGGDHLHYAVYVSGVAVNPVEWWDAAWIRNNVSGRLGMDEP